MNQSYASIGLLNPKTPENVGSVLRAAGCYEAVSIFYTGTRYDRAKAFVTDTKNVHQRIPLLKVDDLRQMMPEGAVPVAIEITKGARSLVDYVHPKQAFYIFGPEDGSIPKSVTQWCKDTVYIPTQGCMNLAATVNVVLYDRFAKSEDVKHAPLV